ncbi:MAG: hypothetical protein QXX20_00535 [Candidatus Thermoplasmatota archaeon]
MNRKEIHEDRERNRTQRLEFVTWYARWVKQTPNKVWSTQQKELVEGVIWVADADAKEKILVTWVGSWDEETRE